MFPDDTSANSAHIDYAILQQNFHLPINQVAKELGVCATVLKKICRKHGIPRWPHRKIKSLNKMINSLEESEPATEEERIQRESELNALHKRKMEIMENPRIIGPTYSHMTRTPPSPSGGAKGKGIPVQVFPAPMSAQQASAEAVIREQNVRAILQQQQRNQKAFPDTFHNEGVLYAPTTFTFHNQSPSQAAMQGQIDPGRHQSPPQISKSPPCSQPEHHNHSNPATEQSEFHPASGTDEFSALQNPGPISPGNSNSGPNPNGFHPPKTGEHSPPGGASNLKGVAAVGILNLQNGPNSPPSVVPAYRYPLPISPAKQSQPGVSSAPADISFYGSQFVNVSYRLPPPPQAIIFSPTRQLSSPSQYTLNPPPGKSLPAGLNRPQPPPLVPAPDMNRTLREQNPEANLPEISSFDQPDNQNSSTDKEFGSPAVESSPGEDSSTSQEDQQSSSEKLESSSPSASTLSNSNHS